MSDDERVGGGGRGVRWMAAEAVPADVGVRDDLPAATNHRRLWHSRTNYLMFV